MKNSDDDLMGTAIVATAAVGLVILGMVFIWGPVVLIIPGAAIAIGVILHIDEQRVHSKKHDQN